MKFNKNSSDGSHDVGTTPTGQVDRRKDGWLDRYDGTALQTHLNV
jgi:hypothetical protein